jgi:hypothetical protein
VADEARLRESAETNSRGARLGWRVSEVRSWWQVWARLRGLLGRGPARVAGLGYRVLVFPRPLEYCGRWLLAGCVGRIMAPLGVLEERMSPVPVGSSEVDAPDLPNHRNAPCVLPSSCYFEW